MEKRGIDEKEQIRVNAKILYLEGRFTDNEGLTKTAGGDIRIDVVDWDMDTIYFGIEIAGELKHKLDYPRKDFQ